MELVDSQAHVWGTAAEGTRPNLDRTSFLPDELLGMMNAAGVGRAVLVPPTWDTLGNKVALEAAVDEPERFAVFGSIDLHESASAVLLPTWLDTPGMFGIRVAFRREPYASWLIDGTTDWLWGAAEDLGIPIMAYLPGRLPLLGEIARRHPRLRLAFDHMSIHPTSRGLAQAQELEDLLSLARHENVSIKLSALPMYSNRTFPYRDTFGMILAIVRKFGAERCFWGTDATRLPCSYGEAVEMFTEWLPGLSSTELELVMGRAIRDWLQWR